MQLFTECDGRLFRVAPTEMRFWRRTQVLFTATGDFYGRWCPKSKEVKVGYGGLCPWELGAWQLY